MGIFFQRYHQSWEKKFNRTSRQENRTRALTVISSSLESSPGRRDSSRQSRSTDGCIPRDTEPPCSSRHPSGNRMADRQVNVLLHPDILLGDEYLGIRF